ncbi:MAG: hypothetical protein Fues2KO_08670 [Fuerstiella sp.]
MRDAIIQFPLTGEITGKPSDKPGKQFVGISGLTTLDFSATFSDNAEVGFAYLFCVGTAVVLWNCWQR